MYSCRLFFACLISGLISQSTIFQLQWTHLYPIVQYHVELMRLAQGHNMVQVGFEPRTTSFRVPCSVDLLTSVSREHYAWLINSSNEYLCMSNISCSLTGSLTGSSAMTCSPSLPLSLPSFFPSLPFFALALKQWHCMV